MESVSEDPFSSRSQATPRATKVFTYLAICELPEDAPLHATALLRGLHLNTPQLPLTFPE